MSAVQALAGCEIIGILVCLALPVTLTPPSCPARARRSFAPSRVRLGARYPTEGGRRRRRSLAATEAFPSEMFGGRGGRGRGGGSGLGLGKRAAPGDVQTIRVARRVFVGNLSYRTSWQDLKDHFAQAGKVIYADVLKGSDERSKGCGIVEYETPEEAAHAIQSLTDTELDGRLIFVREDRDDFELKQELVALGEAPSTGFAAGGGRRFPAPRPLPQAAGGRGMMRGGAHPAPVLKRLRPGPAAAYGAPDLVVTVGRRLYVSNLAYGTTWQNLKDHFAQAGAVVYANVMQGPDGRSKGCGIVEYSTAHEALAAISSLSNSELDGRMILVREDREDRDLAR